MPQILDLQAQNEVCETKLWAAKSQTNEKSHQQNSKKLVKLK